MTVVRAGLAVIPVSSDDSGKGWFGGDFQFQMMTVVSAGLVVNPVPSDDMLTLSGVRHSVSTSSFRQALKTHLFKSAYN